MAAFDEGNAESPFPQQSPLFNSPSAEELDNNGNQSNLFFGARIHNQFYYVIINT